MEKNPAEQIKALQEALVKLVRRDFSELEFEQLREGFDQAIGQLSSDRAAARLRAKLTPKRESVFETRAGHGKSPGSKSEDPPTVKMTPDVGSTLRMAGPSSAGGDPVTRRVELESSSGELERSSTSSSQGSEAEVSAPPGRELGERSSSAAKMIEEEVQELKSSSVTGPRLSAPFAVQHEEIGEEEDDDIYLLSVEDEEGTHRLLYQVVRLGAVLLKPQVLPALNEFFVLRLSMSPLHLTIDIQGRVVHVDGRSAAVEVSSLDREDRATLERALDDVKLGVKPEPVEVQTGEVVLPTSDELREIMGDQASAGSVRRTMKLYNSAASRGGGGDGSLAAMAGRKMMTHKRRQSKSVSRSVEMTLPDPELLSTSAQVNAANEPEDAGGSEFYGPGPLWVDPQGPAARVEELAEDRIIDILMQLSGHEFTGVLQIKSGESARQIHFDTGFAVEVASQPRKAREELGPLLQLAGHIDAEQLAIAAAHADENGISVARSLMVLDLMGADRLRQALAGRLNFLIAEIARMRSGDVEIYDQESLEAGFLPQPPLRVHLSVERVIFKSLYERLRNVSAEHRGNRTREDLDTYPEIVSEEEHRLERAVTARTQRELIARVINGKRRMREVFTESTAGAAETFALIYALHRMGLMRFDRSLHHTVVRERFRENVTVKYLSVHKASYFEVLNVHWSSYDEIIKKAFDDLVEHFDPMDVPENMEAEVHQRVREIRERIESAHQVLSNQEHRRAYRKRIMPEYKLQHAIPLFLRQAKLAERRENWSDAIDAVRRVVEIDPAHEEGQLRLEFFQKRAAGLEEES